MNARQLKVPAACGLKSATGSRGTALCIPHMPLPIGWQFIDLRGERPARRAKTRDISGERSRLLDHSVQQRRQQELGVIEAFRRMSSIATFCRERCVSRDGSVSQLEITVKYAHLSKESSQLYRLRSNLTLHAPTTLRTYITMQTKNLLADQQPYWAISNMPDNFSTTSKDSYVRRPRSHLNCAQRHMQKDRLSGL